MSENRRDWIQFDQSKPFAMLLYSSSTTILMDRDIGEHTGAGFHFNTTTEARSLIKSAAYTAAQLLCVTTF